jgi:hypothetical protein
MRSEPIDTAHRAFREELADSAHPLSSSGPARHGFPTACLASAWLVKGVDDESRDSRATRHAFVALSL